MKENNYYQTPQMREIEMCMEGILCGSQSDGSAPGLEKENLGDIFC